MESLCKLLNETRERLAEAGFEDINLRGNHITLSFDESAAICR